VPNDPELNFYLQSDEDLFAFQAKLDERLVDKRYAVDTEANSLHAFKEKLCLVQFCAAGLHAIVDPLTISPDVFEKFMAQLHQGEVWMHGADFDITMLKRTFDAVPETIFDTQIAARLCGSRQFGLANLVMDVFSVELSKQNQRADWGKRPLTDKMVEYALNDVRYILPLADHYSAKLRELGRYEWFLESCADARETVLNRQPRDQDDAWRIGGSGRLKPLGLAYLRAFWHWRNGEAERVNRPVFKVASNDMLLGFAEDCFNGKEPRFPERFPSSVARRFQKARADAAAIDQSEWPRRRHGLRMPRNAETDKKFEELRAKRDEIATQLDLDPSLLASRTALEQIAVFPEKAEEELMNWQRQLLGF
jgi:ribonuclease D